MALYMTTINAFLIDYTVYFSKFLLLGKIDNRGSIYCRWQKKLYLKINRIRTKLGKGRHQLTIAEWDDFIKVHTKIPANPDIPYIVKSEMLPLGESPSNELYVNMSLSSQTIVNRLLKRPVRHQIQVDFTHDVSVDNLMILMIGISNEGHEYLLIAVVLTSRENEKSVRD